MGEERPPGESPALARSQQTVLYLGDGLLAGLGLYVLVYVLGILFPRLVFAGHWVAIIVIGLFLLALVPKVAVFLAPSRYIPRSPVVHAWREARQWRWIGVLGLLVGSVLVVGSVSMWGGQWPGRGALVVIMGTWVLGMVGRALALYLSEENTDHTE